MSKSPELKFNDGNSIPQLGYGVWQVESDVAEDVVGKALDAGFRHVDTAKIYGNEEGVGKALAESDVPREDVFVTTKLWNEDQGYDSTLAAFDESMQRLGLDELDLYLIHWPAIAKGKYVDTWKAFVELQKQGRVKSIGVSNFPIEQLGEIIEATGVTPAINQVETHPYFNQEELRAFHKEHGILHESWSPLGQGKEVLEDPVIVKIAEKHGATPAQVIIAWHLALGNVVIPKSVTPERIVENFAALDVKLDDEDVEAINGLSKDDGRIGPDPKTADF
ncbi:aldo/keto reductase [Haematomicrobium sanguinis]|uniref:aldo/keto reductase n=1 Tax=Haematomicrobium sanguinis TaxID=479106 RepID=UPI00047ADA62|nr:aldo/keto reductase [Haematomicrobium sanguinis]